MDHPISKQDRKRFGIAQVLNDLLAERPIDQITVVDLCDAAGISRSTFYSYFDDLYQVGEWLWEREVRSLFEGLGASYGYRACFNQLYERLKKTSGRFDLVRPARDQGRATFAQRNTLAILEERVAKTRGRALDAAEHLQLSYVSQANEALTIAWFEDGFSLPISDLVDMVVRLAPPFVIAAVGE